MGFIVLFGLGLGVFRLFLVSSRFLHSLIALEQLKALLLLGSLVVGRDGDLTYFVAFLVMFTLEAVVALVVLTRLWNKRRGFGV